MSATTNRITTPGYAYDAAGNMTNDSLHTYTYDAENRMTKVDNGSAATYTYAGASRVKKVAGGTTTVYVFSGSKVVAEYVNWALSKEYVYSGSSLLATIAAGGATTYHHPDHLSTRVPPASDPLAGSVSSPQSLNRYTYVGNDPVNGVDPLGLKRNRPGRGESGEDDFGGGRGVAIYLALGGGLWGGGSTIDGLDAPPGFAEQLLASGTAGQCPNNDCWVDGHIISGFEYDPTEDLNYAKRQVPGCDRSVVYALRR
ncbi:MAG: hypothetical protein ACRD2Y_06880 [Terriglobales bacterium]